MSTATQLNDWRRAIRGANLPTVAKLVAYTLATYLDSQTLHAYPSQATLAADCGIQTRCLRKALSALKAGGWLATKQHRTGLHYFARFGLENTQDRHDRASLEQQDRHDRASLEQQDRHHRAAQTGTTVPTELDKELVNTPLPPKGEPDEIRTDEECALGRAQAQRILAEIFSTKPMRAGGAQRPMQQNRMTRHRTLAEDLTDRSWAT